MVEMKEAMKCTFCGKAIVLVPSAEQRAKKDVCGNTAAYYTSLFTIHSDCLLKQRDAGTLELLGRLKEKK